MAATPRPWLAPILLAFAGLALLAKYSGAFLALALLAGVALTPARRALGDRRLWARVGLAALLALPAFHWQWSHGFPFPELLENGRRTKNAALSAGQLAGGWPSSRGCSGCRSAWPAWPPCSARAPWRRPGSWGWPAPAWPGCSWRWAGSPTTSRRSSRSSSRLARWRWSRCSLRPWRWAAPALLPLTGLPAVPVAIPLLPPAGLLAVGGRAADHARTFAEVRSYQ